MKKIIFTSFFTIFLLGNLFSQIGIISNVNDSMGYFNSNKLSKIKPIIEYSLNFSLKNINEQYFREKNIPIKYYDFDFSKLDNLSDFKVPDNKIINELSLFCTENKIEDLFIYRKITVYNSFYATDLFFDTNHNYSIYTINSYNSNKAFFFSNFRIYKFNNSTKTIYIPKDQNKIKLNTMQLEKFDDVVYDMSSKKLINKKTEEYYMIEFNKTILNLLDNLYLFKPN